MLRNMSRHLRPKLHLHVIRYMNGFWYGQEELEELILLECYTINIGAADISQKEISLQLKGYALTEWQFHVAHLNSVEQHITAAIKNTVDFECVLVVHFTTNE